MNTLSSIGTFLLQMYLDTVHSIQNTLAATVTNGYAPFLIILAVMTVIMWRAHVSSDSRFNLYDILMTDGKPNIEKIFMTLGGLSVTWWFMDLCAMHKATLQDMVAYAAVIGVAKYVKQTLDIKEKQITLGQPTETKPQNDGSGTSQ